MKSCPCNIDPLVHSGVDPTQVSRAMKFILPDPFQKVVPAPVNQQPQFLLHSVPTRRDPTSMNFSSRSTQYSSSDCCRSKPGSEIPDTKRTVFCVVWVGQACCFQRKHAVSPTAWSHPNPERGPMLPVHPWSASTFIPGFERGKGRPNWRHKFAVNKSTTHNPSTTINVVKFRLIKLITLANNITLN